MFACPNKRSLAPIRALKTARPHGRELGMTVCFDKTIIDLPILFELQHYKENQE
jgi:hypothetical protein